MINHADSVNPAALVQEMRTTWKWTMMIPSSQLRNNSMKHMLVVSHAISFEPDHS